MEKLDKVTKFYPQALYIAINYYPMQEAQLSGQKKVGNKQIKLNIPVVFFEEEGIYYAYMPSMDLTGYGNTQKEAKESLKVVLDEFLRYTINKNTFLSELKRLGWRVANKAKPMTAPKMSDLIRKNEQLRDIINYKQFSTLDYPVNIPAFA